MDVGIPEQIDKELVRALKAKETARVSFLRMMKAALKNKEIENRAPLTDKEVAQVLRTQLKQRIEAMEQFEAGGRSDLAAKERQEREWIGAYLPEAISKEEVEKTVSDVIQELGAAGPEDLGAVMRESMTRLKATGKTVDGKTVNSLVRTMLQGLAEKGSD